MAVDAQGQVYAIELKRDRAPRDVVAQALDYGSWITGLTLDDVREIYRRYRPGETFDDAFAHRLNALRRRGRCTVFNRT
jgi:RecB family endonuclease NucS